MLIRALTITATLALAGSLAWAQPNDNVVDKRRKKADPPDNVVDKRGVRPSGPMVRGFAPQKGPAGTRVTIRGNELPQDVMVQVGARRIKPDASTPRSITFTIPRSARPGARRITLVWKGGRRGVGRFDVGAGDDPGYDKDKDRDRDRDRGDRRDRRDRDRDGDRRDRRDRRDRDGKRGDRDDKRGDYDGKRDRDRDRRDRADRRPGDYDRPGPDRRRDPRARREARRRWHRDRPIVTRFFPRKGSAGTRVTIRGRNFAPDTQVMLGARPVRAKVNERRIAFKIPRGSKGEMIRVKSGPRIIPVGVFEYVDKYDYRAERKRLKAERRAAAEAAWRTRKGKLARDRKARQRAYEERREELARTRAERRRERLAEIRRRWKIAFLRDPETRAELALHAERIARLERMRRLADLNDNGKLAVRIEIAMRLEGDRHDRRMDTLKASFKVD